MRRPGSAEGWDATEADPADPAGILGGEWYEGEGRRYLVIDRKYTPGHRHGRVSVADALPPAEGWPLLGVLGTGEPAPSGSNLLFLDLETTGLAGGAGTYPFLVGCGWFSGGSFRVRQFFLSDYAGERAVLDAVAALVRESATLVTYNGKTFDVPLIDTRFAFHRLPPPFGGLAHLDMVHPARRLWRGESTSRETEHLLNPPHGRRPGAAEVSANAEADLASDCRLLTLERGLLGHERDGDVPGFEIPSRYFHYVRSGDARPLQAVLEHNRLDLLALALMTARAAALLEAGAAGASTAREALGLGRLYERADRRADARACYLRATELAGDTPTHAEALRALALVYRRERCYHEAAIAWRRLVELRRCPAHYVREAVHALAVHHEHRVRDLTQAYAFASKLMDQHRLARLTRKLGEAQGAGLLGG